MFFIDTSTSFLRVENLNLKKVLQILRPDVIIPSRKSIGGANLDEIYNETSQKINSIVGSQGYSSTLLSDGWQNIRRESVVNYCSANNQNTFFLESIATEDQSHSSEWLATDLSRIIQKYQNFAGVCTDNAPANKSAWAILKQQYPDMFFYGCTSHGLHLVVKDIFKSTESTTSSTPINHPFQDLQHTLSGCMTVAKYFRSHCMEFCLLEKEILEQNIYIFQLTGDTRWGSIYACISEYIKNRSQLVSLVLNEDWLNKGTAKQRQ